MASDPSGQTKLLEYCEKAKKLKGTTLVQMVIDPILGDKEVNVFAELLAVPSIASLKDDAKTKAQYEKLNYFCYNTYQQYKANKDLPELKKAQEEKLKRLSVVTLASTCKVLPYKAIQEALGLEDVSSVENIVIECIYAGLLKAKMDHRNSNVLIEFVMGRDVKPSELAAIKATFVDWQQKSAVIHNTLKQKAAYVGDQHNEHNRKQQEINDHIEAMKLKVKEMSAGDLAEATEMLLGGGGDRRRAKKKFGQALHHKMRNL